jgi:hypothetical protein
VKSINGSFSGIRTCHGDRAIRPWRKREHLDCWKSASKMEHAKMLIVEQSLNRINSLLKLRRSELRWDIGHNPFKNKCEVVPVLN